MFFDNFPWRPSGSSIATVTRGQCREMIEEIKSCLPEVKASKSDKWFRSYGHLKICMVSEPCLVHIGVSLRLTTEGAGAYSSPHRPLLEKILTTLFRAWPINYLKMSLWLRACILQ